MLQITNKQKSPIQLIIRSKTRPRSMSVLNIPGLGKGNNVYYLEDELSTEYVERMEKKFGLIKTKYVPDNEFSKQ
jgi:hypothetical protein